MFSSGSVCPCLPGPWLVLLSGDLCGGAGTERGPGAAPFCRVFHLLSSSEELRDFLVGSSLSWGSLLHRTDFLLKQLSWLLSWLLTQIHIFSFLFSFVYISSLGLVLL